ncbi:efflux RND transporter periplasmic adaptor subunit [Kaarinaea lacus]
MPISCFKLRFKQSLLLVLVSTLIACGEEPPPPTETIRSIRTITVTEPASGKVRRFSGVVEAATTSSLSFEVSGNVREVNVDVGQKISKGQVLARLDDKTFRLNVEAAEANVGRANVELEDARREVARLQDVASRGQGLVSQQMLDQAQANQDAARKNLSYAQSRLNLARRDLDRTVLRAPFDAVVAQRHVDAFQEVNRGQKLFDVHVEGAMEAAISIPESEIKLIYLGQPGEVSFPAVQGQAVKGVVSEISSTAGAANAFPVKLTILDSDSRIRPGLTTEVSLMLGSEEGDMAYLIPVQALVPRGAESKSYVYVFNAETSTVKMTAIEHGSIRDNNIIVESGLNAGDIIAVAGVSFLRDGQKVRLMEQ